MLRSFLFFVASLLLIGCRSPYGYNPFAPCGTRVPPPGTGSYGAPNTYYPSAVPRATAVPPSTAPRVINSSLGGWRTSTDDGTSSPLSSAGESLASPAAESSGTAVGTSVRTGLASAGTTQVPTTSSVSTPSKLNGMRVNELKPAVAPASFQSPVGEAVDGNGAAASAENNEPPPRPASSSAPVKVKNTLRNSSASLQTDAWQSRPPAIPAPNRIAGS